MKHVTFIGSVFFDTNKACLFLMIFCHPGLDHIFERYSHEDDEGQTQSVWSYVGSVTVTSGEKYASCVAMKCECKMR